MLDYGMPKMDHITEENTIVSWKIKVGDTVKKGDIIMEVETGKVVLEVEATFAGTVKEILYKEGDVVPVKETILRYE